MKIKLYVRVGRNKKTRHVKVSAGTVPRYGSLVDSHGLPIPTSGFAILLDVPDDVFTRAEQVAGEIEVPLDSIKVLVEEESPPMT